MWNNWIKGWNSCLCSLWSVLIGFDIQLIVWNTILLFDIFYVDLMALHSLGDNFFKSVSYTIEAFSAASFGEEKENLRTVEAQILTKRVEISKFETEYREVQYLILSSDSVELLYESVLIIIGNLNRFWHNLPRWLVDTLKKCKW